MIGFTFSLGSNKYDNQPEQRAAADFQGFIDQIIDTGSTRKGQAFTCAPLSSGQHNDPMKYPGVAPWRISQLALPRCFLAIDGDYFANPEIFAAFKIYTSQWSSLVYTTGSHTPTAPRARAIIELNRSVNRAEGIALGEAVERMLISALGANNIKLDESVYRAEQPVYTPLVGAQTHRFRGLPLDVDAVLAAYPSPTVPAFISSTPQQQVLVSPVTSAILQPPETPTEIAKAHAALAMVSADCSYPDWIEILFALQSTGWNCAKTLAQGWSMSTPHRYDAKVFESVWQNAKPLGGITIATLYHRAKQVSLTGSAASSSMNLSISPTGLVLPTHSGGKMNIPTVAPPPRTYIFGDVVVPGTVAVMAGVGGTAKTGLAIQACIHGALGRNLGSIQTGSFASLMFLAEETPAERDRRFGALCSRLAPQDRARVEQLVQCYAEAGNDLRLTALADGNVIETNWVDQIITLAIAHEREAEAKVGLIVIDHARLVMSGDPIASDHVTALLRALNKIAVNTGSAVLLLAHSPKSTIGKEGEPDASEVFGSGAFVDHSRAAFVLHNMREKEAKHLGFNENQRKEYVRLSVVKANYGKSNQQWWLRKDVVQGWQVVELVPEFLLPKGQAQARSGLVRKIVDIIKAEPGKLTRRALRDLSGVKRSLGASEREVSEALQRALNDGLLILRAPQLEDKKRHNLSANVREVIDIA
jgi:AAA domain/Primase C terminal 2 (PriCT-2)